MFNEFREFFSAVRPDPDGVVDVSSVEGWFQWCIYDGCLFKLIT